MSLLLFIVINLWGENVAFHINMYASFDKSMEIAISTLFSISLGNQEAQNEI